MDIGSYIRQLEKQGYSLNDIRNVLLKYGYTEKQIDQEFYTLHKREVKHTIHLSPATILIVLLILIIGVSAAYVIPTFTTESAPEFLLDVNIVQVNDAVSGETLSGTVDLTNMGSSQRYDVNVKYELFDRANNRVTFKSETVALATTKSHRFELSLERVSSGTYTFKTTVRYQGEVAEASQSVVVGGIQEVATCFDNVQNQGEEGVDCGGPCVSCQRCPNSCDDNNPNTLDYCSSATNFECVNEAQAICGDTICSIEETINSCPEDCGVETDVKPWEEVDRIIVLGKTNPEEAKQECLKLSSPYKDQCLQSVGQSTQSPETCNVITDSYNKDKCFGSVALDLNNINICDNIEKQNRKDNCFVTFALEKGDYSRCDEIENDYLRKSCRTLSQT